MPKLKTNRGAVKRFRLTASGRIKVKGAFHRHILTKKSTKRKRNMRGIHFVHPSDAKAVKRMFNEC